LSDVIGVPALALYAILAALTLVLFYFVERNRTGRNSSVRAAPSGAD
jgi:hypothetical protein